ncbi:hypothetical protein QOZ98_000489 [Planomicrobium stackebrandtii]|uniref:TMhelix containing protein n=1 Tax=Planomicrobium stackebrandtii TaxID=253160 RepID=A0ABU0GQN7_9BACL|nr:hypothetical protein [Planomicrobium stackebrandtii]MDQ0427664.1 hypothetical protein [Planomicrobium stackebrandtii]
MPDGKGDGSMYKKIEIIDDTLDEHGNRISALEKADTEKTETINLLENQFTSIKLDFTNLENTIWKTAQSTQDMMTSQNTQQWKLIEALNGGNQEERARKHDLDKTKAEKRWEFAGKLTALLLSSGSVLYVILEMASK